MTDKLTLAVIGATGRTGVPLVAAAVDRGHTVKALARSAQKAKTLLHGDATVVVGDALDPSAIQDVVQGASVVIDVSGPVRGGAEDYRRRSTEILLDALDQRSGVRLVHLTGAGVRRPGDEPGFLDRAVRGIMGIVARSLLADSTAAVERIDAATVPSLVVRAPRLTDGERVGQVKVAPAVGPESGLQISRSDLAEGLLDLVEEPSWPTGSPVLSS
ncbi:NAD(P)-dependent oxidoreductase [Euzebya tangerina]|uniref:NAD(P)-dependent oxidoreductase n=1 Tax=Euzebya tangerina TaxID=591198 RepID=UPI0013C2F347|nr:NAD(P)H-binding protein [Euzebya tangerina]